MNDRGQIVMQSVTLLVVVVAALVVRAVVPIDGYAPEPGAATCLAKGCASSTAGPWVGGLLLLSTLSVVVLEVRRQRA